MGTITVPHPLAPKHRDWDLSGTDRSSTANS